MTTCSHRVFSLCMGFSKHRRGGAPYYIQGRVTQRFECYTLHSNQKNKTKDWALVQTAASVIQVILETNGYNTTKQNRDTLLYYKTVAPQG